MIIFLPNYQNIVNVPPYDQQKDKNGSMYFSIKVKEKEKKKKTYKFQK
jgi:hypothetical protein